MLSEAQQAEAAAAAAQRTRALEQAVNDAEHNPSISASLENQATAEQAQATNHLDHIHTEASNAGQELGNTINTERKALQETQNNMGGINPEAPEAPEKIAPETPAAKATAAGQRVIWLRIAGRDTYCFVAGTLVHTDRGTVAIQNLRIGDFVLAQPENTGEQAYRRVDNTVSFDDKPIWQVTYRNASGHQERIESTGNHPYWVTGAGWMATEFLLPGDTLELADQTEATVVCAQDTGTVQPVYNIEVNGFHTYYVGEMGAWVHNVNCAETILPSSNVPQPGQPEFVGPVRPANVPVILTTPLPGDANFVEGASTVVSDSSALANAGKTTPGSAIQTYWPPNGGFLGTPVSQTLETGYQFNRYGGFFNDAGTFQDFGSFVAPADVPYGMRALPPGSDLRPLTTYEVVQPIPNVPSGRAAPAFGELGLGTQHQLPLTIQDYLDQGYIKIINQTVPAKP